MAFLVNEELKTSVGSNLEGDLEIDGWGGP